MKLINSSAKFIPQAEGLSGIYKQIELCGRTCYKSENLITDSSADKFVDRLINSNHTAMLEHGTVYLIVKWWHIFKFFKYLLNPYSKIRRFKYITTNLRVIKEHNWDNDLKYICAPTEYHKKRYTFRLITSIGVTRELNRHRVHSIAEQSTRYCNYSKNKFENEVTFCIPSWLDLEEGSYDWDKYFGDWRWIDLSSPIKDQFVANCFYNEKQYMNLINEGWQPQQAREVLPLCTSSEIIHTAFASDWRYFFDLRLFGKTGAPHPNMKLLAEKIKEEAENVGIWEDIMKYSSKFN